MVEDCTDRRCRRHLAIVTIVLLVGGVAGPPVAATAEPTLFAPPTESVDRATVTVQVGSNGSTTVTVAYAQRLPNETAIERFRSSSTPLFAETERLATQTLDRIEDRTGRSTSVAVIDRESRIATGGGLQTEGVRSIQFRVRGLTTEAAATDELAVEIPVQIALSNDHRLVVETGAGLALQSATPEPSAASNTTAEYVGPRTLDGLTIETRQIATDDRRGLATTGALAVAGLMALVVALLVGWWVRRSPSDEESEAEPPAPPTTDPEHLPDDRRVIGLLEDADGRMKQTAIVEATGWSKSKTSMVLSGMADDEQIFKLKVGRENIVCLPEAVPEGVGGPTGNANDSQ
ncbi:helix-turn-helix transcriptional regulator [Halococcoides cellulosivorans]|uniref:DUF7343 domain-containing protein n=1 Tax=Halococcoides cellulosivorans TaxID=1679096 RepID=A0A2R4WZY8_9EURY|nr:hypothetical protein [Halococcoides cellulosivorans]AWB27079.1 hypothetical protein HARCEL1_04840 [Halococcoides cellulosivorans]